MQRFFGLVVLVLFAMPFGLSVAGCGRKSTLQYCTGNLESGPALGQVQKINLSPNLSVSGESLNYGQIGPGLSASAADCTGAAVTVSSYTFSSTDISIADINPSNGSICAGSWNRGSGGGIADYSICTPPAVSNEKHQAYITASASGVTSNPIAVYIHPPVTGVVLGNPTPVASCATDPDPATNCFVFNTASSQTSAVSVTNGYDGATCLSQGQSGQLVARVYSNGDTQPQHNITNQVGPVVFGLQGATNVATVSPQGIATANQPGSALITASVSNSSSALNSGFISTCPPASITIAAVNQPPGASNVNVAINSAQSFTANVIDTRGNPITGLALEFNSTLPVNFPTSGGSVTPVFPGSSTITAVCNPGACNPAPFSQIGFLGNGKPITSNGITVTATGTSASVLYMASAPSSATGNGSTVSNAGSLYIISEDFTTGQLGAAVRLPFLPNSMVISQDGSTIYLGSAQGLMVFTTASNSVANTYTNVQGTVLAVAPNNSYVVVTDGTRDTVSLVTPSGAVASSFNGVGTRAAWTPDSSTLYVIAHDPGAIASNTTANQLLTYSTFTGWENTNLDPTQAYNDVAVTVPAVGAYFAGSARTEGRSYCASSTFGAGSPPSVTNIFSPVADTQAVPSDRLAATTDGKHLLSAALGANGPQLTDFNVANLRSSQTAQACPMGPTPYNYFTSAVAGTLPVANITVTPTNGGGQGDPVSGITGVVPATNSSVAAITYNGRSGVLPLYAPAVTGLGTLSYVPLSGGAATAPVAGVFSSDNTTFYAGTSGDNQVHIIAITGGSGKDTGIITPNLPDPTGGVAVPNLIAARVRRTTS